MKAAVAATVMLLMTVGGVHASAYSEFNAGITTQVRSDKLAVEHFSAALADPGLLANLRPVAFLDRGTAYQRLGKYDLALTDFTASLALRPTFDAFLRRAVIHRLRLEPELAIQDVTSAIAIRPDLATGYEMLGFFYVDLGRVDEAIAALTTALAATPNDAELFVNRSTYYLYKADYASAMSDADKAIAFSNGSAASYAAKAAIYEAEGQLADALVLIEQALGKTPRALLWVMKKGIIQWEDHDFDRALATFAQATEIAPSGVYPFLWLKVARADAHAADSDARERALKLDLSKWPGPVVQLYLDNLQPEAVMAAASANPVLRRGQVCEANFYIGQWQRTHGNLDEAKARLRAVLADCPLGFVERPAAANQLKTLQ
jgi:lipoprotein NlpI